MFVRSILLGALSFGAHAQGSGSGSGSSSSSSSSAAPASSSAIQAQTTLALFVGSYPSEKFIGSIVSADSCSTIIALVCTAGEYELGGLSTSCNPSSTATFTYGPGFFKASTARQVNGAKATIVESCSLAGTTEAVCSASIYISENGKHTATSSIVTRSGANVGFADVPITAGASKVSGLGKCTATAGSGAAPTGISEVYKVVIVPAAAALLAGAFV